MNYYNEYDKHAANWLRNLIKGGMIPAGDVDDRSIEDVRPDDLREYTQHHFFAGIGGWPLALQMAGWATDRPVWTGSCPCQSFSTAGKRKGTSDKRHLWPVWYELIKACKPPVILGEQVEAAIGHGWLDLVSDDLGRSGYEIGAAVLPACSIGAYHIRKRLWFMAYSNGTGYRTCVQGFQSNHGGGRQTGSMADSLNEGSQRGLHRWPHPKRETQHGYAGCDSTTGDIWSEPDWIYCRDGKYRPIEPGTLPLADGVSKRVVKIRGYGNAIVPPLAAEFIKAGMEYIQEQI